MRVYFNLGDRRSGKTTLATYEASKITDNEDYLFIGNSINNIIPIKDKILREHTKE